MPIIRTPLISLGSNLKGTPDAVGTHKFVTIIASYFDGSAVLCTESLISSNNFPETRVSELNGTYPTDLLAP